MKSKESYECGDQDQSAINERQADREFCCQLSRQIYNVATNFPRILRNHLLNYGSEICVCLTTKIVDNFASLNSV